MKTFFASKVRACFSGAVLVVSALALASSAQAQSPTIKVNIPFSFENGTEHLPAGVYTLQMSESGRILLIRGNSASGMTLILPDENSQPAKVGKVVFHRYGDRYFLREVWTAGSTSHVHTSTSKAEKNVELAQNNVAPNGVEVALLELPR
jgi:hypothetical protein